MWRSLICSLRLLFFVCFSEDLFEELRDKRSLLAPLLRRLMGNPTLIPYPFLLALSSILVNRLPGLAQPAINARAHGDNEKDKENVERIVDRHEKGVVRHGARNIYTHVYPLAWLRQSMYPCCDTRMETRVCTRVGGLTPSPLCIYQQSIRSLGRKCITL